MRQGPNPRRSRSRSSTPPGGSGSGGGGGGGRRQNVPLRHQTFDSNGPDVRIRGNAYQVHEKYLALARDANASGDRIAAENYLQHAEHYHRIINQSDGGAENGRGRVPRADETAGSGPPQKGNGHYGNGRTAHAGGANGNAHAHSHGGVANGNGSLGNGNGSGVGNGLQPGNGADYADEQTGDEEAEVLMTAHQSLNA